MILNIESLFNREKEQVDFDLSEDIKYFELYQEKYELLSPMHLVGKVVRAGKNYIIKADVDFVYKTNCSRCLCDVEVPVNYSLDAYLMRENYDEANFEDSDVFLLDGMEVNLTDIVNSTMTYNIPLKVLCNDDCKGICSGCGADLNTEKCVCVDSIDIDDIDPRFAKLKELLK